MTRVTAIRGKHHEIPLALRTVEVIVSPAGEGELDQPQPVAIPAWWQEGD